MLAGTLAILYSICVLSVILCRTSSKAQLRVSVSALLPLLPTLIIPQVLTSRYCTAKSDALVIQADDSRKAKDNEQSCYKKLYSIIFEAATEAIPGETSLEQSERVKRLYVQKRRVVEDGDGRCG